MTLKKWLEKERASIWTVTDIARELGVNKSAVSNWVNGWNKPSLARQARIRQITRGEVCPEDWV